MFEAAGLTSNDSAGPANESGQLLTVTAVAATAGTHGTVSLLAGQVTYAEDDYYGPASFSYTVADNGTTAGDADAKSDTATVSVTVSEVQRRPSGGRRLRWPGGRGRRAGVRSGRPDEQRFGALSSLASC